VERNTFVFRNEIVITRSWYDHAAVDGTTNCRRRPQRSLDDYSKNRSSNTVDLTGWQLDGGMNFSICSGPNDGSRRLPRGGEGHKRAPRHLSGVPMPATYSKNLSHRGDVIILRDPSGNPANQIHYSPQDDGQISPLGAVRASNYADRMRHSKAEAWAASNESDKSPGATTPTKRRPRTSLGHSSG